MVGKERLIPRAQIDVSQHSFFFIGAAPAKGSVLEFYCGTAAVVGAVWWVWSEKAQGEKKAFKTNR